MKWWPRRRRRPLPPDERDFRRRLEHLPVGWAILMPDRGLVAERTGRHSWAFWRTDFREGEQHVTQTQAR